MENNVFVVSAVINTEDRNESTTLGVFTNEKDAQEYALNEFKTQYEKDLNEMYEGNDELLEKTEMSNYLEYHSNCDYYNIEVIIRQMALNDKSNKINSFIND